MFVHPDPSQVIITRGNNVYGPHQYPEKLIPKFINQVEKEPTRALVHQLGCAWDELGIDCVFEAAPIAHVLSREGQCAGRNQKC